MTDIARISACCSQPQTLSVGESDEVDLPPTEFDIVEDIAEDDLPVIVVDAVAEDNEVPLKPSSRSPANKAMAARNPQPKCPDKIANRRALLERLRKQANEILGRHCGRPATQRGEALSKKGK